MRDFFNYYKWHLFFIGLFVVCIMVFTISSCTKSEPDLIINCVTTSYVNDQTFIDKKGALEDLLHDSNNDKKKVITFNSFTYDLQNDLDEVFLSVATAKDSDIIMGTKKTFENFEDKSKFDTVTNFLRDAGSEKYNTLTDDSGRIYAVSLEGNEFIDLMDFMDATDIYIAVMADDSDDGELSYNKKNARNIALYIIKEGIV